MSNLSDDAKKFRKIFYEYQDDVSLSEEEFYGKNKELTSVKFFDDLLEHIYIFSEGKYIYRKNYCQTQEVFDNYESFIEYYNYMESTLYDDIQKLY